VVQNLSLQGYEKGSRNWYGRRATLAGRRRAASLPRILRCRASERKE